MLPQQIQTEYDEYEASKALISTLGANIEPNLRLQAYYNAERLLLSDGWWNQNGDKMVRKAELEQLQQGIKSIKAEIATLNRSKCQISSCEINFV